MNIKWQADYLQQDCNRNQSSPARCWYGELCKLSNSHGVMVTLNSTKDVKYLCIEVHRDVYCICIYSTNKIIHICIWMVDQKWAWFKQEVKLNRANVCNIF